MWSFGFLNVKVMIMDKKWILCIILLIVVLSGCTDKKIEPVKNDTNLTPAIITPVFTVPEPSTVYVEIKGSMFTPSELKVINGTTVRWTNMDSARHIVIGDGFRSPALNKKDMWNYTFNRTGIFEYNCSIHPSMQRARIIVE